MFSWAPDVTLMRTEKAENEAMGEMIAKKVNASKGAVTILLPLGGLSKIGAEGEVFYKPEIDKVLFEAIKRNVNEHITVQEVNANINTVEFAEHAVKALLNLM